MKKGISPIVAVVLLIAIAVIAAVGLYFWVGGLATKQPTPDTPIVISAQKTSCTSDATVAGDSISVLIQNLDASDSYVNATQLPYIVDDNGAVMIATTATTIAAGQQQAYTFTNKTGASAADLTSGSTYTIISSAGAGSAVVIC